MRLKSFYGATLSEAMKAVREALGDDAIIVATRDDEGGVRVTAAIEEKNPVPPPSPVLDEAAGNADAALIETLARTLLRAGVSHAISERLLAAATQYAGDDPALALSAAFDTHLTFHPLGDEKSDKPLLFLGPPGAGKTLLVARLATRAHMAGRAVAAIGTDLERAGGMEQLAAFTRLLNVPLLEIEDPPALREALLIQNPATSVFIDTAGCNPFDPAQVQKMAAWATAANGTAFFVLPADMDAAEAIDMIEALRPLGLQGLIFTRLDLTRRLGVALRVAFETHMPLCCYTDSNKVTAPPQPFNPVSLARLFLPAEEGSVLSSHVA